MLSNLVHAKLCLKVLKATFSLSNWQFDLAYVIALSLAICPGDFRQLLVRENECLLELADSNLALLSSRVFAYSRPISKFCSKWFSTQCLHSTASPSVAQV